MAILVVARSNVERPGETTHTALVVTRESVGPVDTQVVLGREFPRPAQLFAVLDCVRAYSIRRIAGANLKDSRLFAGIDEIQPERAAVIICINRS